MKTYFKWTAHFSLAAIASTAFLTLPSFHATSVVAQAPSQPVKTPRLYVFDLGKLPVPDPKSYNFAQGEIPPVPLVVAAYLIVHPKGTLMWDTGLVPDADVGTAAARSERAEGHRLRDELAKVGYKPEGITFLALSHYHSDHTGNANQFKGSTWLVQKAERDVMFAGQPQRVMIPSHFTELENAKTILIEKDDYDVFGDGTVLIKATPGHTAGHQVLVVRLAKTGPVMLVGDLYHFPEERNTDKFPTWEANIEQARASRAKVEAFLKQSKAQLWIEHDIRNHEKLKKAPEYYE